LFSNYTYTPQLATPASVLGRTYFRARFAECMGHHDVLAESCGSRAGHIVHVRVVSNCEQYLTDVDHRIHQPSAELFEVFDRLLLLRKGGKTVYFGDIGSRSKQLLEYFENNGARICSPDENP
jgi:ABC-2 type transporter